MDSIRSGYEKNGVTDFYKKFGDSYRNPHESIIQEFFPIFLAKFKLDITNTLDLACGSGEISLLVEKFGGKVTGVDPYTTKIYKERTGKIALPYSFEDIQKGKLTGFYSSVICSFALHLVDVSRLSIVLYQLSRITDTLLILSPHKKPVINDFFYLVGELDYKRVKGRLFHT